MHKNVGALNVRVDKFSWVLKIFNSKIFKIDSQFIVHLYY